MTTMVLTTRELDFVVAKRKQKFRPRLFRQIFQVDHSVPEWAERVTVQKVATFGDIQPTATGGSDNVRAPTINRSQNFLSVFEFEGFFEVRDSEVGRFQELGMQSPSVVLAGANQVVCEGVLEELACIGSSGRANWPTIPGLANNADAVSAKATTGTGGWDITDDPDDILNEMCAAIDAVYTNTLQNYEADTLLMPVEKRQLIGRMRMGDGTSETILQAFRASYDRPIRVLGWNHLKTAGTGSTTRMVSAHLSSEESPRILIARELTEHRPPARKRTGWEVGQTMRTAGCLIENYRMIHYTDGI
jgi:hypothetical protein